MGFHSIIGNYTKDQEIRKRETGILHMVFEGIMERAGKRVVKTWSLEIQEHES